MFTDACEWEGVTVRGGEAARAVPEERLAKSDRHAALGPRMRRGDPQFRRNERVLVRSVFGQNGLAAWNEADPLRPARIELVSIRGKGTKQFVEYDLR